MANRPKPTDLRDRRLALGISLNEMAHGLGMRLADLAEIEDGKATDDHMNNYARWLSAIERWPEEHLRRQIERADGGHRFRQPD